MPLFSSSFLHPIASRSPLHSFPASACAVKRLSARVHSVCSTSSYSHNRRTAIPQLLNLPATSPRPSCRRSDEWHWPCSEVRIYKMTSWAQERGAFRSLWFAVVIWHDQGFYNSLISQASCRFRLATSFALRRCLLLMTPKSCCASSATWKSLSSDS